MLMTDLHRFIGSTHPITSSEKPKRPTVGAWFYVNGAIKETSFKLQPDYAKERGWRVSTERRAEALRRIIDSDNFEGGVIAWTENKGFDLRDLQPCTRELIRVCKPKVLPNEFLRTDLDRLLAFDDSQFKTAEKLAKIMARVEIAAFDEEREKQFLKLAEKLGISVEDAQSLPTTDQDVWHYAASQKRMMDDA